MHGDALVCTSAVPPGPPSTKSSSLPSPGSTGGYLATPELVYTMPWSDLVRGITVLYGEIYILRFRSSDVEIYDRDKFALQTRIKVASLMRASDLVASAVHACIYISDIGIDGIGRFVVHRVGLEGTVTEWMVGDDRPVGLSVTAGVHAVGCNVIVACDKTTRELVDAPKLKEYATDGELLREITLPGDVLNPRQGIQLASGEFLVCHGAAMYTSSAAADGAEEPGPLHRVCVVDPVDGHVTASYGGAPGSSIGHLNDPRNVAVDGRGFVFVTDRRNRRVLLLSPGLTYVRELISRHRGTESVDRFCLDEARGRICLTETTSEGFLHMMIFKIKDK